MIRADRDAEVLRLRREDYSYREIQAATGMNHANAVRLVMQHLEDIPKADADELRQWEREKLNEMERSARPQAYDFFAELDADGKPVSEPLCNGDGVVMLDDNGAPLLRIRRDWNTANQGRALLIKIHEARSKMFGLAAPTRTSTTFENGFEEDREVIFRIVDNRSSHPEIQALDDDEMHQVILYIRANKLGQQKLLGVSHE